MLNKPTEPSAGTATPEQKKMLELFMIAAGKLINDPNNKANIVKLTRDDDPIDAIAKAAFGVIVKVENAAMADGVKLDPTVELEALNQIVGTIVQLYVKEGGKDLTDEQKYQAFSMAIALYLEDATKTGKIAPGEMEQLLQMLQQDPAAKEMSDKIMAGMAVEPQVQTVKPPTTGLLG